MLFRKRCEHEYRPLGEYETIPVDLWVKIRGNERFLRICAKCGDWSMAKRQPDRI